MKKSFLLLCMFVFSNPLLAQVDESQTGAWYMYFFNSRFNEGPWGIQGDYQYRHWDLLGDMEQLLLRTGVTYTPEGTNVTLTLGYANITTGEFGESRATFGENRIYQEALIHQKIGQRLFLVHRFRSEQRWVDQQNFRSRYRYNIFANIPFNQHDLSKGAVYLALYNEIFINGQRSIGDGRRVDYFDRNRSYIALGYSLTDTFRFQFGWMEQTTEFWQKGQLQIGFFQNFSF